MFHTLVSLRRRPFALVLLAWLLTLLASGQTAHAQPPALAWTASFSGNPVAMKTDAQGNVYVTGTISSFGSGYDFGTVKYDANGNQLWLAHYNGPANSYDVPVAMALDAQGNVYVTGESDEAGGTADFATVKYDTNGNQLWAARYTGAYYTGSSEDYVKSLAVDAQGNVYITGASNTIHGDFFYTTIKYNTNGNQLWVATYGGAYERATKLAVDTQGNVYVTGNSSGSYATVKYNTNGRQQWAVRYAGGSVPNAITVDAQGSVYITGSSYGSDYATVKYDTNGNQQWAARYTGPGNSAGAARDIALDAQGNVYVTGSSDGRAAVTYYNAGDSSSDYATVKYDPNGNQLWAARYNGPGNDYDAATAIAVDAQGNAYVTGTSAAQATVGFGSYGSNNSLGYATIKYDANGNQLWLTRSSSGSAVALALDTQGDVYVTGSYATLKYSPSSAASPDITSQVSVTRSGFRYVRATGLYAQTVTVSNASGSSFAGPLTLVLDGLGNGITLFNRAGVTATQVPLNSPYLSSTLANIGNGDGMFDPGESVTFTLTFANPSSMFILYTPRVLAGIATP